MQSRSQSQPTKRHTTVFERLPKPSGGTPVPPAMAGQRGMGVPPMSPGKQYFKY
jgi:hypothetical protein